MVGVNEANSEYDYNYETEFQIWKENNEFQRQNILMSHPPFDSKGKLSPLDSTPVGAEMTNPEKLTLPTELSKRI